MADSTVPITIAYRAPGIQPPLFVAGSFSHPQWVPQEMDYTTGEDGEFNFSKAFDVEPNAKIQYKFRVGPGDWWVLDEGAPIVTDDAGNRNNFIEAPSAEESKPDEPVQATKIDDDLSSTNHIQHPQPAGRIEALKEADKVDRSGTSTPEYARTAAEVAESAALVDPPTSQPETVDAVASTPPQETADTAAEVADTAQDLDKDLAEEHTETVVPAHKTVADIKEDLQKDNLDVAGFSNEPEPVPLFARIYEDDEIPGVPDDEQRAEIVNGSTHDQAKEDFQDPTLERFPSSRMSSKESQHLSLPLAQPQENLSERSLSVASLGSIAEDDEVNASTAEEIAPIVEQAETADEAIKVAKNAEDDIPVASANDEDEAVVMKDGKGKDKNMENGQSGYLTPERATTPKPEERGSPSEPAPNTADPVEDAALVTEPEPTTMPVPPSPKIVVSKAEDIQPQEVLDEEPSSNENGHKDIQAPPPSAGQDENGSRSEPAATSSAIEDNQPSSLKKRSAPQSESRDRSGTPAPIPDNDWEAAKNGNWFSAFFRLIFVDWVGGFVSRLCGSRRKTT
ncbi:putative pt repeat family protein [Diaporthe ampelina]|uniref:Putative pt repeat family protein n=1 Tax=Diaporthe ampelina TaxID=1214573 RepID=A0A0G2FPK2_9PEZI|nr:putative pt repeat family protein [Diaporthe ampelina]